MQLTLDTIRKQLTPGEWVGLDGTLVVRGGDRRPLTGADSAGILSLVQLLPQIIEAVTEHDPAAPGAKPSPITAPPEAAATRRRGR